MEDGQSLRSRLIRSAIELFGAGGLSVGTRAIAQAAGAQMSAITYYFEGKDGLYRACAEHIAGEISRRIAPGLDDAERVRGAGDDAEDAAAAVCEILSRFLTVLTADDMAPMARFVMREQMNPSPAFKLIYDGAMRRVLDRLAALLQDVSGGVLSNEAARVRAIALIGQVLAFRFAQAAVLATTGWRQVGPAEIETVRAVVLAHTRAVLADLRRGDVAIPSSQRSFA